MHSISLFVNNQTIFFLNQSDGIFNLEIGIQSADQIFDLQILIRSANRITISRSNIQSADRILRSHDATGDAAMKTIKLQHNKPNNNNSHNFSHFEKYCILLVYLSIIKQFFS